MALALQQQGTRPRFTLTDELRDEDHFSPTKFIEMMKLDVGTFAQFARVHRNTVTRAPASLSVQRPIRDVVKVLAAMFAVTGDNAKSIYWFKNEPLPEFGYKTAEEVVADGRIDDVIKLIEMYQAGFAG